MLAKCYGSRKPIPSSRSEQKLNAVFAKNVFEREQKRAAASRRRIPIIIHDLPILNTDEHQLLNDTDSSFKVNRGKKRKNQPRDSTFDRLLRSNTRNLSTKKATEFYNTNSSSSESCSQSESESRDTGCFTHDDDNVEENLSQNYNVCKKLDFTEIIHTSLGNVADGSILWKSFDVEHVALAGAAKRKNGNEKSVEELQSSRRNDVIMSISKLQKNCSGLGKQVICSTPIISNKQLRRQDTISPIKVHDSANSNILAASVAQIFDWNFLAPDKSAYDPIIRRKTTRLKRTEESRLDAKLHKSKFVTRRASRKYATNVFNECEQAEAMKEWKVNISRISPSKMKEMVTLQNKRYQSLDDFMRNEFQRSNPEFEYHIVTRSRSVGDAKRMKKRSRSLETSLETFEDFYTKSIASNDEKTPEKSKNRSEFVTKRKPHKPNFDSQFSVHCPIIDSPDLFDDDLDANPPQLERETDNHISTNFDMPFLEPELPSSTSWDGSKCDTSVYNQTANSTNLSIVNNCTSNFSGRERSSILTRNSTKLSTNSAIIANDVVSHTPECNCKLPIKTEFIQPISLAPGKKWRRSLAVHKRRTSTLNTRDSTLGNLSILGNSMHNTPRKHTFSVIPPKRSSRILQSTRYEQAAVETRSLEKLIEDISLNAVTAALNVTSPPLPPPKDYPSARELVLRYCKQSEPQLFARCYNKKKLVNCRKIGEGVYGEVFLYGNKAQELRVMKVIPIEGTHLVNGETQKKFEEIISEIIIASELSNLRENAVNATNAFNEVLAVRCVRGRYPKFLRDLWELYDESKGSENDNPEMFDSKQLYIVLELAYAGSDLESMVFDNYCEIFHVFVQIALSLAVAEDELQFEHRDLHWGNVLISKVDKLKKCLFHLSGEELVVETEGVFVTIIDFTMSRITHNRICCYNDLSADPDLFNAEGDYQFEIYRKMQENNGNNWETYAPYSNTLWLHYLLDKMTTSVKLVKTRVSKNDKYYLNLLIDWKDNVLGYKSAKHFSEEVVANYFRP